MRDASIAHGVFCPNHSDIWSFHLDCLDGRELYPPAKSVATVVFPDCGDALLEDVRLTRALKDFRDADKRTRCNMLDSKCPALYAAQRVGSFFLP